MRFPEDVNDDVLKRLRRLEGQILGWLYSVDFPIRVKTDAKDRKQMSVSGLTFWFTNDDRNVGSTPRNAKYRRRKAALSAARSSSTSSR